MNLGVNYEKTKSVKKIDKAIGELKQQLDSLNSDKKSNKDKKEARDRETR